MKRGLVISKNKELSTLLIELLNFNDTCFEQVDGPFSNKSNIDQYDFVILDYSLSISIDEFLIKQKENSICCKR